MRLSAPRRRRASGFTLLEAIVTLVIVSLLVTVLMQALSHALSLRTRLLRFQGEARVAYLQEAWFRETVAGAQLDLGDALGPLEGSSQSLAYATPAPLVANGMARVRWWVERGTQGESLHYADAATADLVIVAGPLEQASFSYLDRQGEWHREWQPEEDAEETMPQLIRFEARSQRGSLDWLVPLMADGRPLDTLRRDDNDGL